MSQTHFGVGSGRLSAAEKKRRQRVAKAHGAEFCSVNGNQGHCVCGHGCSLDTCPILSYWFSGPNLGQPFDGQLARAVEADLAR